MNEPVCRRDGAAVLFDAGGTLITLDHDRIRRALGLPVPDLPDDKLLSADGVARLWVDDAVRAGAETRELWDGYFSRLLEKAGLSKGSIPEALNTLWRANREDGLWRTPVPGAREVLARLAALGYRLAVVSNAEGQVEADLRNAGLADHLETVVDSHRVGAAKPDPRIFEIALDRLAIEPRQCVYVGDIPAYDVDGARAAGIEPILLDPHGIHAAVDAVTISSLQELTTVLASCLPIR